MAEERNFVEGITEILARMKSITPEEAKKLEALGFELKVIYKNKCILCGKKFTSKDENKLKKKLEKHIDEECDDAKWVKGASEILRIMGLKNVVMGDVYYAEYGKFPKGYKRTKPEELDMLNRIRDLLNSYN